MSESRPDELADDWLSAAANPPERPTDAEVYGAIIDGGLHLGRSETEWIQADQATTIDLGDAR